MQVRITSAIEFKKQAESLKNRLNALNIEVSHAQALEGLAAAHGFRSWHACSAQLTQVGLVPGDELLRASELTPASPESELPMDFDGTQWLARDGSFEYYDGKPKCSESDAVSLYQDIVDKMKLGQDYKCLSNALLGLAEAALFPNTGIHFDYLEDVGGQAADLVSNLKKFRNSVEDSRQYDFDPTKAVPALIVVMSAMWAAKQQYSLKDLAVLFSNGGYTEQRALLVKLPVNSRERASFSLLLGNWAQRV